MNSVLKAIGVFGIVALTVTAIPGSFAQTNLPDQTVCRRAINSKRSGWVEGIYAEEASRRGLTFRACDEMNNLPASVDTVETEENDQTYNSPVPDSATPEQRAFLEAATYFITGLDVDPSKGDVVSNAQITFGKYSAVAYLYEDIPCAVRVRATSLPYVIWQIDFCKITSWETQSRFGYPIVYWHGAKDGFCIYRGFDLKNENYQGYIGLGNSNCSPGGEVWTSLLDIESLVGKRNSNPTYYSRRPLDRMIASFKYIETLLTGKPY